MKIKALAAVFVLLVLVAALFSGCAGREKSGNMEFMRNEAGDAYTLVYFKNDAKITTLTVPDSFHDLPVTAIGKLAIQSCENLEKINIGPNVTEIDAWAIADCRYLERITVSPENPNYCDVDGVLFNKEKTALLAYPNANSETLAGKEEKDRLGAVAYNVPEGVTTIGYGAFFYSYALEAITLPPTVTAIEPRAFQRCQYLLQINIPEGVTTIGTDAFLYCDKLPEIVLPSTLRSIGDFAFNHCTNLLSLTVLAPQDQLEQGERWLPEPKNGKAIEPVWGG